MTDQWMDTTDHAATAVSPPPVPTGDWMDTSEHSAQPKPVANPQLGPSPAMAKVGNTIFQDIANAPSHIMNFLSGHPVDQAIEGLQNFTAARHAHLDRAVDAFKKGDYQTAATQGFFGSVPFLGPALGAAADEYEAGHKPEAVAHAIEILLPVLHNPAMGALESNAAATLGKAADVAAAGVSGGISGGLRGAIKPVSYGRFNLQIPQSIAGAAAGGYAARALGLPHEAGAIVGAALPVVQGALRGARQAIAEKMVGPDLLESFAQLKYQKAFKDLEVGQQSQVLGAAAAASKKNTVLPDSVTQELTRPTEAATTSPVSPQAPPVSPQAPPAQPSATVPPKTETSSKPISDFPEKARGVRANNAESLAQAFQDAGENPENLRVWQWPAKAKEYGLDFPATHEARLKWVQETIRRWQQKQATKP